MAKDSFILHHDSLGILDKLSNEQAGKLFKAIKSYSINGDVECDDNITELLLHPFQMQLDRDLEKWKSIAGRNKANGSKGGRPKNPEEPKEPSGLSGNPEEPKEPVSVSGSVKASASGKETITFESFYIAYPKKVGRKEAKAKWNKLSDEDKEKAYAGISNFTANKEKQFISAPVVYLNGERWNDEMQEKNNGTSKNQAIPKQPDNSATRHHDRLKKKYAEAVARELDGEAVQQIPSDIQS